MNEIGALAHVEAIGQLSYRFMILNAPVGTNYLSAFLGSLQLCAEVTGADT
jgi:hypothetical protein